MAAITNKKPKLYFVDTLRIFIIAKLSIRKYAVYLD